MLVSQLGSLGSIQLLNVVGPWSAAKLFDARSEANGRVRPHGYGVTSRGFYPSYDTGTKR